jgi:CheY-like chemotaxis protein
VRVLAVDDDEDSREVFLLSMRTAGAEVMVVGTAASALAALRSFSPHVVVADLAMPGMDGYALVREIGAGADAPPVIALSACASPADGERAVLDGFACHLAKPTDYRQLVLSVAELARLK